MTWSRLKPLLQVISCITFQILANPLNWLSLNPCDWVGTKIGTMPDLTDRQQAILDFVRERIAADGMPPTWAEIARAFGFRQTRAAQKHLQALEAKGYLTLLPGKARGIRVRNLKATPVRSAID